MGIRTLLVDDLEENTIILKKMLEQHCPEVEVISVCNTPQEAIEAINTLKPRVVFCDIEMPVMNGFEMIDAIEKIDFDVIFVTSHDDYMLKAFKYSAIDYIVKPPQAVDLINAVKRVSKKKSNLTSDQLNEFISNLKGSGGDKKKITLNTHERIVFVSVDEIIRCEASGVYTVFHLRDGKKHMVSKNIQKYEEMLEEQGFFRPHRSHIINLSYVKEFVKEGEGYMLMADGSRVDISRYKKEEVLKKLGTY